jgi:hypothetical protein
MINALVLRLPGLSPQQAHLLGQTVARKLARRVESLNPRQLNRALRSGSMDVHLRLPAALPLERLADALTEKILASLYEGTG